MRGILLMLAAAALLATAGAVVGCGGGDDSPSSATGVVEAFLESGDPDERCALIYDSESGEGADICSQFSSLPAYEDVTATEDSCSDDNPDDFSTGAGCSVDAEFGGGQTADFTVVKTDDGKYLIDNAYNITEVGE